MVFQLTVILTFFAEQQLLTAIKIDEKERKKRQRQKKRRRAVSNSRKILGIVNELNLYKACSAASFAACHDD